MGKEKRLELLWQLCRTSLPVWDLENFRPMDFCWHECTTTLKRSIVHSPRNISCFCWTRHDIATVSDINEANRLVLLLQPFVVLGSFFDCTLDSCLKLWNLIRVAIKLNCWCCYNAPIKYAVTRVPVLSYEPADLSSNSRPLACLPCNLLCQPVNKMRSKIILQRQLRRLWSVTVQNRGKQDNNSSKLYLRRCYEHINSTKCSGYSILRLRATSCIVPVSRPLSVGMVLFDFCGEQLLYP